LFEPLVKILSVIQQPTVAFRPQSILGDLPLHAPLERPDGNPAVRCCLTLREQVGTRNFSRKVAHFRSAQASGDEIPNAAEL
jgi:hypothetical protein